MSTFFEHVGPRGRVQAALNVLLEAPFFYRDDDPELFTFMRRHRAELARFWEECFGWQLVIDARCARLYKPRWYNGALKRSQHDVFEPTRRDECIAFLLVLELHERLLEERNVAPDDPEPIRFEIGELFAYAKGRLAEELGDDAYDDEAIRRLYRRLIPLLLRFRFLREIPPDRDDRATLDRDRYLYECLPALHAYDVRAISPQALKRALSERHEDDAAYTEPLDGSPGDREVRS
jgi:hypothetical protein